MEEKEIVVEDKAEEKCECCKDDKKCNCAEDKKCCCDKSKLMCLLPIFFGLGAIVMGLLYQFLPIVATVNATIKAAGAFMFIGYALATTALVLEVVKFIQKKEFKFSLTHLIILIAFTVVIF